MFVTKGAMTAAAVFADTEALRIRSFEFGLQITELEGTPRPPAYRLWGRKKARGYGGL